jgi:predicted Zn finger-like uncharacterized protein
MHVQCESCATQYEFDDALVSGRGTTVKCSNCGYQFKVRKAGTDDQWLVTTADGSTFVYGSLRELQRAILSRQIDVSDLLERGGVAPRPIGQIAELAPFFDEKRRLSSVAPEADGPATERSVTPPPERPVAVDPDRTAATPARLLEEHLAATRTPVPPPPVAVPPIFGAAGVPTLPGAGASPLASTLAMAPIRPRVGTEPDFLAHVPSPRSLEDLDGDDLPTRLADGPEPPGQASAPVRVDTPYEPKVELAPEVSALPAPRDAWRSSVDSAAPMDRPIEVTSPLPPPARRIEAGPEEWTDSGVPRAPKPRRSVGGLVVAAVVVLGIGGLAAYYVRTHPSEKVAVALDPKAEAFLAAGEKALTDGELDRAKENLDKASVLAEKHPRLLLGYAKLATARADVAWIQVLVAPDPGAVQPKARELAASALESTDAALAAAPDDPSVLRARIDALRASGQVDKARALVAKITSQGNQAETAYVLATLDMASPDPVWSTVLQRLRLAASSEGAGGRARAALVVALVRAGDLEGARGEVARLEAGAAGHPLVAPLRAYVDRSKGAPAASVASAEDGGVAGVDVSSLKALGAGAPTDPRVLVSQAEIARSHGKLDVAKRLYELALQKNPTDSEALTGLAHVAHAQRDVGTAKDAYKRALSQNPSYVPALVGLADVEWESGDRAAAQKSYREIVERFPESAYPMRVKVRADGQGPAAPQASTAPTASAPTPAASTPPSDPPPQAPSAAPVPPPPAPSPKPEEPSP